MVLNHKFKKKLRVGELSYWIVCNLLLKKCEERWLIVARVSHNLCETLEVSRELEFIKSGVSIGQMGRISGHGDEYERKGKSAKLEKWSHDTKKKKKVYVYILWAVSKEVDLKILLR